MNGVDKEPGKMEGDAKNTLQEIDSSAAVKPDSTVNDGEDGDEVDFKDEPLDEEGLQGQQEDVKTTTDTASLKSEGNGVPKEVTQNPDSQTQDLTCTSVNKEVEDLVEVKEEPDQEQDQKTTTDTASSEDNGVPKEMIQMPDSQTQDLTSVNNEDEDIVEVKEEPEEDGPGESNRGQDEVSKSRETIEKSSESPEKQFEDKAAEVSEIKDEVMECGDNQNHSILDFSSAVKEESETPDYQAMLYEPSQDSAYCVSPNSPMVPLVDVKIEDTENDKENIGNASAMEKELEQNGGNLSEKEITIESAGVEPMVIEVDPLQLSADVTDKQEADKSVEDPWGLLGSRSTESKSGEQQAEVNTEVLLGDLDKEEESYIMDYSARTEEELLRDDNENEVDLNSTRNVVPDSDIANSSIVSVSSPPDENDIIAETQQTEADEEDAPTTKIGQKRKRRARNLIISSESDSSSDELHASSSSAVINQVADADMSAASTSSDSEEDIAPVAITSMETFQDALTNLFEHRKRYACLSTKYKMKILLESGDLSDTIFVVGPKKVHVKAHKYVLTNKSEFFSTLFSERWANCGSEAGVIDIPDVEPEDFRSLLQFLYTGDVNMRSVNALPLLYLSRVYGIRFLEQRAINHLLNNIGPKTAFPIFASLVDIVDSAENLKRLSEAAANYITKNALLIFNDNANLQCKITDVAKLFMLKEKKFTLKEELKLFLACYQLAKEECSEKGLEINGPNCRTILEPVMQYIRFPLMSFMEHSKVKNTNILTDDEWVALACYRGCPSDRFADLLLEVQKFFNARPRLTTEFSCNRFSEIRTRPKSWVYGRRRNKPDRISFKVNTDIALRAIGLFGCAEPTSALQSENYKIEITVSYHEDVFGHSIGSVVGDFVDGLSSREGRLFRVSFRTPVNLIAGIMYTISLQVLEGERTYFGMGGMQETVVNCQNYQVRFEFDEAKSRLLDNGTGVTIGQIPVLYFSLGEDSRITDIEIID